MTSSAHDYRPAAKDFLIAPPPLLDARNPSLFLDFDGTLVTIAELPHAIKVKAALPALLTRLNEALNGRLAIISGRAIADLDRHLHVSGLAMAGSHGCEMRASGSDRIETLAAPIPAAIEKTMRDLAARHGGLLIESKPFSTAIHFRARPEAGPEILQHTARLADEAGLAFKPGKMVAEIIMPGADKGRAVDRFMQMPTFSGSHPVFVGDDITDEDAFRSVLGHDGGGILVGPERETAALWRLPAVNDVHRWLKAAAA